MSHTVRPQGRSLEFWSYLTNPLAASFAMVPVFYGFQVKSAQQTGRPIPPLAARKLLVDSTKAGAILGVRVLIQEAMEKKVAKIRDDESGQTVSVTSKAVSAFVITSASLLPLTAFQGRTLGYSISQSIKQLSLKVAAAIILRDSKFLFALSYNASIIERIKLKFGNSRKIDYGLAFISGCLWGLIGQIEDGAATRWHARLKIENVRQLMWGAPVRSLTIGGYFVCYKLMQQAFAIDRKKRIDFG